MSAKNSRIVLALRRLDDVLCSVPQTTLDWLSQSELQRYGSFSSDTRRQQFLCGRYLAREAIGYFYGRPWSTFYLSAPEVGPPRITGKSGSGVLESSSISISHTDGWVACVVSECLVGVDVQSRKKLRDITALSLIVGCGFVGESSPSDEERTLAFYANWGLREAWIKQSSQDSGISMPSFIPSVGTQTVAVGLVSDLGDATLAVYPVASSVEFIPGFIQVTDWARWSPLMNVA